MCLAQRLDAPEAKASQHSASPSVLTCGEVHITMVPHRDLLRTDCLDEETLVVTHMKTCEQLRFQHGPYELTYDDEGFGSLLRKGPLMHDEVPIMLEDKFRFVLYKNEVTSHDAIAVKGAEKDQYVHLNEFKAKSTAHEVTLRLGAINAEKSFQIFAYKWPRSPAARIMWDTKGIYAGLDFDQFRGQQWRWVNGSWRRWQQVMSDDFGMAEHVLPSAAMKERPNPHRDPSLGPMFLCAPLCEARGWL